MAGRQVLNTQSDASLLRYPDTPYTQNLRANGTVAYDDKTARGGYPLGYSAELFSQSRTAPTHLHVSPGNRLVSLLA